MPSRQRPCYRDITAILRLALPNLRARWPIQSLVLFGSRVRTDATPTSDLDVLVTFGRRVPLSSFLALEQTLSEITGLRVDLGEAMSLKPYIAKHVLAEAVPL